MQAQGKRLLARYLSAIFALSFSSRRIFFKRWFWSLICQSEVSMPLDLAHHLKNVAVLIPSCWQTSDMDMND